MSGRRGTTIPSFPRLPRTPASWSAVLRKRNVDAMKMNGTVVFLDRPPEALAPSGDRPLADDPEKIRRLYDERYPVYRSSADIVLKVGGTPEYTAEKLLEKLR